jgi:hypothetical protein
VLCGEILDAPGVARFSRMGIPPQCLEPPERKIRVFRLAGLATIAA